MITPSWKFGKYVSNGECRMQNVECRNEVEIPTGVLRIVGIECRMQSAECRMQRIDF